MTSLSERLEDLKKTEAPATLKNSGLAKLEAALENFKELVRNGQTQPRGYQLRSVDQGILQSSIYNTPTATPGTS
ncbi:MAG: hypothetical protein GX569_08090 [Candidatus Riflebacteria bacterium]|nr:hypothetical protein [Candidatus Riflebacteria bacterium]